MSIKQKVLVGTLLTGTGCVLVGTLIGAIPVVVIGGVAIGISCRKRILFKKNKNKPQHQKKKSFFSKFKSNKNKEPEQPKQPKVEEKKSFFSKLKLKKKSKQPKPMLDEKFIIRESQPGQIYEGKIDDFNFDDVFN